MSNTEQFDTIRRLNEARSPAERLPEAVEALAPGIERGHHLALVAGEGARLCRLYCAAAIRDLGDASTARAVVLVAGDERARRLARSIERYGSRLGWDTVLWSAERAASGVPIADRALIVATPAALLSDIRAGSLSLDEVRLLALDDVAALADEWPAVDALLQAFDSDVRRIAATHRPDADFEKLLERLLPRARRWPSELLTPSEEDQKPQGPPLMYTAVPGHDARLARLVEMLHGFAADPDLGVVTVWCDPAQIEAIDAALSIDGFATTLEAVGDGVRVLAFSDDADVEEGPSIVFGLPWSAGELANCLGSARRRAAIVEPRHVGQLRILADRAGWPCRALADRARAHRTEIEAFRARIVDAMSSRDLATAALLIEPLVEEHGFERVSSAVTALLRETDIGRESARGEEPQATASAELRSGAADPVRTAPSADAARATRPTWSKLFVNIGRQDGAAPGDFVGAITGETGAVGAQIGKIDIRQKFSLIDIDSMVVESVLSGLTGKQIKGRDVVVRLDRDG